MSWVLLGQILIMMFCGGLLVEAVAIALIAALIDKRREDAIKRKEAGL